MLKNRKYEKNHGDICVDGQKDFDTWKTGKNSQVDQDQWGGNEPFDISRPEDWTEDEFCWRFVMTDDVDDGVCPTSTSRHDKVCES